ncbi:MULTISPECIES: ABC transporter ATP-binding protein [Clostridium]|uniref:ABC transporter ATP-binding protein n=1 Tax=Clostridium TaxID=1485 RepID=UPI000825845B|nr:MULTISPECIES: ABC transporter ATP-binding protein [Clostridium]PJI08251.1 ABC transporter ATP-binding protein [Clostridium sp. CT7]
MVSIKNVSKKIGNKEILKNINIEVQKGNIFGLIGPNGAGKTTLIKCLTGIYKVNSGQITILGQNVFENVDVKKHIGYVADQNDYFIYFDIKNLIKFYKITYESFDMDRFNSLNKVFKIPINTSVKKLSKGMKMKLALMLNLSIMPEVLVLDEPTGGLDPIAKKQSINIILDEVASRGTTVFISSHNLNNLERMCDSVGILIDGEMKYKNSVEEMKKTIRKIQVVFKDKAPESMSKWGNVIKVEKVGRVYNIITDKYDDNFIKRLDESEISFKEEIGMSLEDMFIYSVGGGQEYEEILK